MDGEPEGTQDRSDRAPTWVLALAVIFVLYLGFRLVEGVVWIVGKF